MSSRFIPPYADVGNGITPEDGAKLYFYETGTSTPANTYSDEALATPNTNPVISNADGIFSDIWLDDGARYKVSLKDKNDVQIWEADPVVATVSPSLIIKTYDTVSDMVASTTLNIGDNVVTLGYSSAGDGLGSYYQIVAAGTGVADSAKFINLATHQAKFVDTSQSIKFDTVSALTASNLPDGIVVGTNGYYASDDGGAAIYKIMTAAAYAATPDEYADHTLANGNIAKLLIANTLNVKQHGLSPTLGDNQTAIEKFIAYWMPSGRRAYVPKGTYSHTGRMLFDVTLAAGRELPELFGDGPYDSTFSSTSQVAPVYHIYGSAAGPDHFQGKLSRIGFQTDLPSIGFAIGLSDFSDNHGNYTIDQVYFGNGNSTNNAAAETLQLNWLFDCLFSNCVVVGKPNYGKALNLRQSHFCTYYGGSYSNAYYGIQFDVAGSSFSNTFISPDIENTTIAIASFNVNQHRNRFITPYIDIRDPVLGAEPAGGYMFDIQQGNVGGITIEDVLNARSYSELYTGNSISPGTNPNLLSVKGKYSGQTTPALPLSDVAETNKTGQTQRITIWGGTVSDIFVNGVQYTGLTGGQFVLNNGDFIAIRYTVAPTWEWKAVHD